MRKIIGIIIILVIGIVVYLAYFSSNQRVVPEEPLLCEGQPCNVIFIISEALHARHMGIYGYERDTTPFIDEFFGKESIVFENAWSNAPWTVPSFAALFTSRLASDVFLQGPGDKLSETIPTFIDVLEKHGIPKFAAHTWTTFPEPNLDWNLITRFKPEERFRGTDPFLFLKAAEWIAKQTQKDNGTPFFLLLQPFAPHSPYDPPEPYRFLFGGPSEYPGPVTTDEISKVENALQRGENVEAELQRFRLQYDQEVRYLNSEFESFISRIPEEVLGSTVFIFTADHGEAFGQHGLLDHGRDLYQEQIHIPFLVRVPGVEPKRIQEPITHLDTGPTILEIFGLGSPDIFRGTSLLPLLQGEELQVEDRIVRAEYLYVKLAYSLDWSKIEPRPRTTRFEVDERVIEVKWTIAVRKGEWKLFIKHEYQGGDISSAFELYNLEQDYQEQNNLFPQWHSLSQEEQAQILPLFEVLDENPPF